MRAWTAFFLLISLNVASYAASDLDPVLLKERIKKAHGDLGVKAKGDWQVSYKGKVETWKWSEKGWSCPKDAGLNCSEWVPTSFRWWAIGKGWLSEWQPTSKLGFEFGKPKAETVPVSSISVNSAATEGVATNSLVTEQFREVQNEHSPEKQEERDLVGGKRWALEAWQWTNSRGESSKVYVSLRDQRIERIDFDNTTEFLEWMEKPGKTTPELVRVSLEKNGERIVFSSGRK